MQFILRRNQIKLQEHIALKDAEIQSGDLVSAKWSGKLVGGEVYFDEEDQLYIIWNKMERKQDWAIEMFTPLSAHNQRHTIAITAIQQESVLSNNPNCQSNINNVYVAIDLQIHSLLVLVCI